MGLRDKLPPLVHPFKPSPLVDWRVVSLERSWLLGRYDDPQVNDEFTRFLYRDLSNLAFNAVYGLCPIPFPVANLFYFYQPLYSLEVAVPLTVFGISAVDFYCYATMDPNQPRMAKIRGRLAFVISLIAVYIVTFPLSSCHVQCQNLTDPFSYMWKRPPIQYQKHCIEVISAYVTCAMFVALFCTPLPGLKVSVAVCWALILYGLGYLLPDLAPIRTLPASKLAPMWIVYSCLVVGTIVITYVRDRLRMAQFEQAVQVEKLARNAAERSDEADALLCAMLPESALSRLLQNQPVRDVVPSATVMFSDMVSFTAWSSRRSAREVVSMLNVLVPLFDDWSVIAGVEKVKTIGDAYWAVAGLPDPSTDHADRMCRFARGLLDRLVNANLLNPQWDNIQLRVGVHSGPLPGAILGSKQIAYEPFGITNHLAEEVEKHGIAGKVVCSDSTKALLVDETCTGPVFTWDPSEDEGLRGHEGLPATIMGYVVTTGDADATEQKASQEVLLEEVRSQLTHRSKRSMVTSSSAQRTARDRFLQTRSHKPASHTTGASRAALIAVPLDLEQVQKKYSEQKFAFPNPFADLLDADAEREYHAWARPLHAPLRHTCRAVSVCWPVLIVICCLIEGAYIPPASWVLWALAFACEVGALVLSIMDKLPRVDVLMTVVGNALLLIGTGLVPRAVVANDVAYLFNLFTVPLFLGTVDFPWPVLMVLSVVFNAAPVYYFLFESILYFTHGSCEVITYIYLCYLVRFSECHLRNQFLEQKVAQFYHERIVQTTHAQRELLKTIVPERIITPLMAWMVAGLKPEQSIVRVYPNTAVGFVKLFPEAKSDSPQEKHDGDLAVTTLHAADWMLDAHVKIDAVLEQFGRIEKIKTIGDIVMLAGPFAKEYQADAAGEAVNSVATTVTIDPQKQEAVQLAADELLAICVLARKVAAIRAGLHVGEVVGAVLGTSRLAFDIFGDAVNVSSRVMTTCPVIGAVATSGEFQQAWDRGGRRGRNMILPDGALKLGPGVSRTFKGKGAVEVFEVIKFPSDEEMLSMSSATAAADAFGQNATTAALDEDEQIAELAENPLSAAAPMIAPPRS